MIKKIASYLVCLIGLLIVPLYYTIILEEFAKASEIVLVCVIFLLAINHDKLDAFKFFGLEAQLKKTIHEANVTISQLKEIAASVSKTALSTMMSDNFIGGMTLRRRTALFNETIESLRKIGFSDAELADITEDWNKGACWIYSRLISNKIFERYVENDPQLRTQRNALSAEYNALGNFKTWRAPTAQNISDFAHSKGWQLDNEIVTLIQDYQIFLDSGSIRDGDRFFAEDV